MTRWLACVLLLVASGCTRNAILELELELPPQPASGPQRYVVVQARSDLGFDVEWQDVPMDGQALAAECTRPDPTVACDERMLDPACSQVISIVGDGNDVSRPLRVRVRFCVDPRCEAPEDASAPEHRVEIERAFYIARYTQARTCIDELPVTTDPVPEQIERCEVRCRQGTAALHCRLDGTHFCE